MAAPSQGPQLTLKKFFSVWLKKPTGGPMQNAQQNLSMSRHQAPKKMGPLVWCRLMEAWLGQAPMSSSRWCCLTSWIDITTCPGAGTKEKWEASKRHWHIFKGKVPRLSALKLKLDSCCQSKMDFRQTSFVMSCCILCHPIKLSVSKGGNVVVYTTTELPTLETVVSTLQTEVST